MSNTVSPEFSVQADELISHYPVSKRSAALPLLHLWQEKHGFVSEDGIDWIAAKLELEPINILELVTFYPMFRREAIGKHHIKVCRTLSCALGGAHETHRCIREKIGAEGDVHEPLTSPDGKFTVEYVDCIASCGTAPVVMIDEDFYENVCTDQVDGLLKKYN